MKRTLLAISLVLALLVIIGCGPQPATPTPTATKPAPVPSPTPSATVAPKPSPTPSPTVAQPKSGGIINFVLRVVPAGYDMHRMPSYGPQVGLPIFNNLVRFDDSKKETSMQTLVGDLADKWEVSADGKVWTFYLHPGVTWHDGNPFSADDVVYSMDKMVDKNRSSISTNFPVYDHIEKIDANTVKIYLKQPSPSFLIQLAGPYAVIESKKLADVDWKKTDFLVGTGPYKLKSWVSGVSVELTRNPNYFKKDQFGKQLPYLDGMIQTVMMDRTAEMDAFITKKFDITAPFAGIVTQEQLDRVSTQAKEAQVGTRTPAQGSALWFNLKSKPFDDVRVRKALALLVDRKQMVTAAYGSEIWGRAYAFFYGPYALTEADINKTVGWDQPWDARVAQAKKLLADAGLASGFSFKLLVSSTPEAVKEVTVLADLYKRYLGVDCQLDVREYNDARAQRDKGNFQVILSEILTNLGEPDETVPYFVSTSPINFTGYNSPTVDQLADQQSKTNDPVKRQQLTQQIEKTLLTDLPAAPVLGNVFRVGWWPYVKGFYLQDISYGPYMAFERTWLDK